MERLSAAVVAAADGGDTKVRTEVEQLVDEMSADQDWAALADRLRRVLAGDRDLGLTEGLDEVGTEVMAAVLDQLPPASTSAVPDQRAAEQLPNPDSGHVEAR